ncbi:hypothetical protein BZG06_16225, partial [Salinivibrio kushneri]
TKGGFANENALLKLLYAGMLKASEKWTHPVQNWKVAVCRYVEGVREVDASGAELEPDIVPTEHPLRRTARRLRRSLNVG